MKSITRLLALLLALALIGCGGTTAVQNSSGPSESTSQDDGADLLPIAGIDAETYPYIDGSVACHPLLARIYEEICGISTDEAETLVPFNLSGTLMVWTKMLGGTSYMSTAPDLLIAYEPPEYVKESRAEKLANFEIDPIGRDALVFLVNADNPVDNLTTQQLYDIYAGKITDWSEVGGGAGEIQAFQRDDYSGSQALFMKLLMHGDTPIEVPTELRGNAMGWLDESVAQFDGSADALGYGLYYCIGLMSTDESIKLLSIDGVAPTKESIADGTYPLTGDFYVAISADEPADSPTRALRDWLLTDAGRQLLEKENYVWARSGMQPASAGAGNPFSEG